MRGVSVVIPVHNREQLVVRSLDSVAAQTRLPDRLIVVDNNSSDNTVEVVSRWIETHRDCGMEMLLLHEPKRGASAARNTGLAAVETEYVYFFDSDDVMHPELLKEAMRHVGTSDLIYWKAEVHKLDGETRIKPFHTDDLLRRQFYNSILSTQVYLVKTDLVRKVGGWNEEAMVWNDWELGLRIALSEPKSVALDRVLASIYAQEESITGRSFRNRFGEWENTLDMVEDFIIANGGERKRRLLDMLDYRRAILAAHYQQEGAYGYADTLLARALARKRPRWRRLLLRLLYHYTAAGGRAAYYLW